MKRSLMASMAVVAALCAGTGRASATRFELTYDYSGSVFTVDPVTGFESTSISEAGVIDATSALPTPDYLTFADSNIRVNLFSDSFGFAASFAALGGTGYATAFGFPFDPSGPNGFAASVVDKDGLRAFNGSISGSFSVAAISSVPLPAPAPLFGTALLALAAVGLRRGRAKGATRAPHPSMSSREV